MTHSIFEIQGQKLVFGVPVPIGTGEANEAANVGAGAGVFRDKVAATINLRSISGTGGIVTSVNGDVVEVDGSNAGPGGDVVGPAGATDEAIARYDTATGKLLQDSLAKVDDAGNITTPGNVDGRDVSVDGATLDSHVANTSNPHSTTAAQVGADPVGSAAAVQTNLDTHIADNTNPHAVTAAQAGADPAGTAAAERAAHEAAFDHANLPTTSEKAALQGTSGSPSGANRYVTNADPRNSDSRSPSGAAGGDLSGTYPNPTVPHVTLSNNPHNVTAGQVGAIPTAEKAAANGVATLDAGTKIPIAQIPDSARPIVHEVADAAARIALGLGVDDEGHEAIQADDSSQWLWTGTAWVSRLAAAGDVVGPASAGDNEIAVYDGATGKLIKRPDAPISANGQSITNVNLVDGRDVSVDGAKLDGIAAGAQPNQDIVAGAGLTGGGSGATVNLAADFGTGAGQVVEGNDTRVPTQPENDALQGTDGTPSGTNRYVTNSDDRLPTQDENDALQGTDGSPSGLNKYVTDSDSRLTDDRYPTTHNPSHENGGADEINVAGLSGVLADPQTPANHAIGGSAHTVSTLTELNSKISDATLDDSGDPRDPNAHQTTHIKGGSDVIDVEELGSGSEPTDRFLASDGAGGNKWVPAATPGTIEPDDAAQEGTADTYSRGDHQHAVSTQAPAQGIGGGNAEGSATSFSRSDHDHALRETGGPTDLTIGAIGDGQTLQRSGGQLIGVDDVSYGFWNGTFIETFDALVTSDGATVTLSLEQAGGGDLNMRFSDGITLLDCTPAKTVVLTPGSDTAPTENYVYIPISTKVLTVSTSDWPTEEHIKVAFVLVPSATFVQADGCYINQNWNDHGAGTNGQGHLAHLAEHIRLSSKGAVWHSGASTTVNITTNGGAPDNVDLLVAAGVAFQAHRHITPAVDTSAGGEMLVVNHFTTPYQQITDLNTQLLDANGVSMAGRFFNIIVWAVANKTGEYAPLMINLPLGSYNSLASAIADIDNNDVSNIPSSFIQESGTGFLLSRLTFRHSAASGGTWTLEDQRDLRGVIPGGSPAGAGGVSSAEFSDNQFRVLDDLDPTKKLAFQCSGITTGQTRTMTVPDADGIIERRGKLYESGGPTELDIGAIGDGELIRRNGTNVVGVPGSTSQSALFGANMVNVFDATVRSSGSTSWQQAARLSTGSIPAGTYRVGWSFNWNHDDKGSQFKAQIEQDDTTQLHLQEEKPVADDGSFGATGTKEKYASSGFRFVSLSAGSYTFDLDFSTETAGKTSSVWNARLEFWRVS